MNNQGKGGNSLERTISAEERIRRAEEIYQRRRMQNGVRVSTRNVNTTKKVEYRMFKKLILQIVICLLIYFIFYLIKNSNYIFSEDVIKKTREFLSYDINFQKIYIGIQDYYNNNIKSIFYKEENNEQENIEQMSNEILNEQIDEVNNQENINEEVVTNEVIGGIGGGEEGVNLLLNEMVEASNEENTKSEEVELTQMEIDANEIKANYSFVLPLKGTITSRFGEREATEIVSANHTGIDIGVNEGTIFVAAMEGIVTCVSSEGGYGNHVYIQNGDVITLYAHCKTIYVKEGNTISQGQQIGEVGQTGNATGPHLHFEIRKENRIVNPELVLAF